MSTVTGFARSGSFIRTYGAAVALRPRRDLKRTPPSTEPSRNSPRPTMWATDMERRDGVNASGERRAAPPSRRRHHDQDERTGDAGREAWRRHGRILRPSGLAAPLCRGPLCRSARGDAASGLLHLRRGDVGNPRRRTAACRRRIREHDDAARRKRFLIVGQLSTYPAAGAGCRRRAGPG